MHGLVVGRFQPLHHGHVQLIQHALQQCGRVTVAIGSAQARDTRDNPFTADEREAMLRAVFAAELAAGRLRIAHLDDVGDDERWHSAALKRIGLVDAFVGNDGRTSRIFAAHGTKVLAPGLVDRPRLQATAIRTLLAKRDATWRAAVPPQVATLLDKWNAEARLAELAPPP